MSWKTDGQKNYRLKESKETEQPNAIDLVFPFAITNIVDKIGEI